MLRLIHWRLGPNKVIVGGYLQPVLDGVKLITKIIFKNNKVYIIFIFPPIISFILSFLLWGIFFFRRIKLKILFFFIIMGLNSFVFILAGWSRFSKFRYLGGVRASSQTISYEIRLTINITVSIFFFYNLNLNYFTEKIFFFFFYSCNIVGINYTIRNKSGPFWF
jgi:NADH-quinone oxidoreductase subunit H